MNQGYQQSEAVAARLDSQLESMADKPAGRLQGSDQSTLNGSAVGVPGYYHTQNSADDTRLIYRLKAAGQSNQQISQLLGIPVDDIRLTAVGNEGNGRSAMSGFKVDLTQKDVDAFEKIRQEKLQVEFDDWVTHAINLSDPGEARWLQQMYPQFWERREKFLDDQINVEARAAKIRLRGIKSVEDMKFLFAVSKGYIKLPQTTAFSATPGHVAGGAATYQRGFFRRTGSPLSNVSLPPDQAFTAAFSPIQGPGAARNTLAGF